MSDIDKSHALDQPPPGYAAGIFFLVWAAVGWYGILFNPPLIATFRGPGLDPGPSILPIIVSIALSAGGLWLVFRGAMMRNSGLKNVPLHVAAIPMLFLLSALLTAILIGFVGFRLPAFVFAALWLFVLSAQQRILWKRITFSVVLAAAIILLIQTVFVQLLRVPLP